MAGTEGEQRNILDSETSPPAKKPFDADEYLLENLVWFLANMDEESPKYSEILAWYAFLKTGKYQAEGRHEDLLDAISRLAESVRTTPEGDPNLEKGFIYLEACSIGSLSSVGSWKTWMRLFSIAS